MPPPHALVLELMQLGPHPFRDRDTAKPETPAPGLPADVRKSQEIERLRLAQPARLPPPGGGPPEFDQTRLAGMQFQGELREPLAKVHQEPFRVILDRKSTRLNSSHITISYAVFCLKK